MISRKYILIQNELNRSSKVARHFSLTKRSTGFFLRLYLHIKVLAITKATNLNRYLGGEVKAILKSVLISL